ncbi:hypothetical protein OG458_42410 (plasmid) [Streptomyces sp. NBC_01281]|uniref:hypothetical protein n=1 Tax=Streptomyces sp. NBC_01281 TaxID=2903811 RepID=UPI002E1271E3|nr:hypothetical protein OG458_41395 [Streptomyces sp. NBC_01281]WSK66610.1 hypothetical protein OG458_42410 [Streptomyces sp. NBC_01281]
MTLIPTYADYLARQELQTRPSETDARVHWVRYEQSIHDLVRAMMADPHIQGHQGWVTDILAEELLEAFFGRAWVTEKFAVADEEGLHRVLPAHRRRELARRVFEFQNFSWFQHFVDYIRTNDIPSALYEADVLAALMYLPGTVVRTEETGVTGQDFDILVDHHGGRPRIPVEVKNKDDGREFTANTVQKTVKKAATQLPKGEVGWLFLKIPTAWIGSRLENEYGEVLHDAVRQTSRIGAVFTAIDKVHPSPDGKKVAVSRRWHYFPSNTAPEALLKTSFDLYQLLERDLDFLAPKAPF